MASGSAQLRKRMGFLERAKLVHGNSTPADADTARRDASYSPVTERYSETDASEEEGGAVDEEGGEDEDEGGGRLVESPVAEAESDEDVRMARRARRSTSRSGGSDTEHDVDTSLDKGKGRAYPPTGMSPERPTYRRAESSEDGPAPVSPSRSAWYEFDLSVVVALVSPVGNWLTGGDHIKNLLLLLLLIFYLHQVIEVPWSLYHSSRPRRRPPPSSVLSPAELCYLQKATSELRTLELFFLALTLASPFLGALLLRRATTAVLGTDVVSWFSTGLFVLATGIRPWSHLIERLRQRTADLQDVVQSGAPSSSPPAFDAKAELARVESRLDVVAADTAKLRAEAKGAARLEDVYDHVDDALDATEATLRAQERKHAAARAAQDTRLAALEAALEAIRSAPPPPERVVYVQAAPQSPTQRWSPADWLPAWLVPATTSRHPPPRYFAPTSPNRSRAGAPLPRLRLETIPEDDDGTGDAYPMAPPGISTFVPARAEPDTKHTNQQQQARLWRVPGLNLVLRCGDLATFPLRTALWYLLTRPAALRTPRGV